MSVEVHPSYLKAVDAVAELCFRAGRWHEIFSNLIPFVPRPTGVTLELRSPPENASASEVLLVICLESAPALPVTTVEAMVRIAVPSIPQVLGVAIRVGKYTPLDGGTVIRPAVTGVSIGANCRGVDHSYPTGTLGAVVKWNEHPTKRFILSANHVVALNGIALDGPETRRILQPARAAEHEAPLEHVIATIEELPDICELRTTPNRGDWALAQVVGDVSAGGHHPQLRSEQPIAAEKAVGEFVHKIGAKSNQTKGWVSGVRGTFFLVYGSLGAGFEFTQQLSVMDTGNRAFAQPGDSGSLAITRDGEAVGLVYADGPTGSVICPLRPLFDELGLSFVV